MTLAFLILAHADPERIRVIDASGSLQDIKSKVELELVDL